MSFDAYKARLRHAMWTWRENKVSRYHKSPRNKDRRDGRNDKRAARQDDKREIDKEREP